MLPPSVMAEASSFSGFLSPQNLCISCSLEEDVSNIKGLTVAYLSIGEISARMDDLEVKLLERSDVVSIERLSEYSALNKVLKFMC